MSKWLDATCDRLAQAGWKVEEVSDSEGERWVQAAAPGTDGVRYELYVEQGADGKEDAAVVTTKLVLGLGTDLGYLIGTTEVANLDWDNAEQDADYW